MSDNNSQAAQPEGGMSKKAAKKAAAKAAKAAEKAARAAADEERRLKAAAEAAAKYADVFGIRDVVRSRAEDRKDDALMLVSAVNGEAVSEKEVTVRARVHTCRAAGGNLCFLVLRHQYHTMQAVVCKSEAVPKEMVKFAQGITAESVVDVSGVLCTPEEELKSCSVQDAELQVTKLFVVSRAEPTLPVQIADCMTPLGALEEQAQRIEAITAKLADVQLDAAGKPANEAEAEKQRAIQAEAEAARTLRGVDLNTRLDNRCLDVRTPANQAIFRIQHAVCLLFREYLTENGFTEIHTPKMLGCKSEGGANVFEVQYFDKHAYLAQSPQFYKQMAIASDFQRVFEIGPVFRAEKSFTKRHMTEFVGLDCEMAFNHHYHEVLDMFDGLFHHLFRGLETRFAAEIAAVRAYCPSEPLKYKERAPRLTFKEACEMLRAAGAEQSEQEDLNTANERLLGQLVREKYDADFFMLDKFPTGHGPEDWVRPFYTMLDPVDDRFTNSYDFFIRGQEVMSGAQRVHDAEMLIERAQAHNVDMDTITSYVDSFRYGCQPHAGGGIGLERVVFLFLGLDSIFQSSLFPRTPVRLAP